MGKRIWASEVTDWDVVSVLRIWPNIIYDFEQFLKLANPIYIYIQKILIISVRDNDSNKSKRNEKKNNNNQKTTTKNDRQEQRGDERYSKKVKANWFCCVLT